MPIKKLPAKKGLRELKKIPKAPNKKAIEKECFKLIQQIALAQDPRCICCGLPSVAGHHLFGRGLAAAFNPEMVRGLCLLHHDLAHAMPRIFGEAMRIRIGWRYLELEQMSRVVIPYMDFAAKRDDLKTFLAELERRAT